MRAIGVKMQMKPTSIIGLKGTHQPKHVMGSLKVMSAISPSDFNKGHPNGMNEIYGNTSNSSDIVWQPLGLKQSSHSSHKMKSKLEKSKR